MPTNIDELQIEINAKSQKANDALENLIGKIDRLSTSLGKIDSSSLSGLASGVNLLGTAMQSMNNVKTTDFNRLARNLQNLSNINTSGLNTTAVSITQFATALNGFGPVSANAQAVGDMAKNIAKLGNKSVQTAITNMPQLASSLNNLMVTLSRSPQVSQNVIQMTNALANLARQGNNVSTASNIITTGLNKTTTATQKASSGFKGLASYIGKFYAKYFLVVRSIKKMWSSIEGTADYIEAYNYFNVAMGKIGSDWSYQYEKYGYENAETYSKSFEKRLSESIGSLSGLNIVIGADGKGLLTESGMQNLGLNIQEITQYASQLASITNSVGQTGETSLAISSSFTKLAGDISSLFNVDYSSVAKNLQSGLIGQSRALYKYGIDITNATLQTKAYELGLSKAVSEMTQAEKMQLRTLAILEQSKVSWGDLANTITSPSNMIRQLSNNLKETGMVLGQLFIPMLSNVLPIANGVTIALKRMLVEIAGFFGVKIDLDKFGQGYTELEDDLGGITDGYEDVTAAVKEWQNQVMKFDEINKLSDNTDVELGNVTGGEIDLTDKILDATSEYEKVWNECFNNMESTSAKWADKVEKALAGVGKVVEDFAIGDFFSAGEDVSKLVIDFNNFIAKAISNVDWDGLGENVGKFLRGIKWIDVFKSLNGVIESALDGAVDFWFASLKESPFETLLLSSIALLNVGTIQNALSAKLGTKISPLKVLAYIELAIAGIELSTDIGQKIAEQITGVRVDLSGYDMVKELFNLSAEDWKGAWGEFLSDYFGISTESEDAIAYSATTALKNAVEQINDEFGKYETDAKNYFRLSTNYDNLTDVQKEYVKQYADMFAEKFPEIAGYIDDVTGAWEGTYEQLDKVIKKTKEYYLENAKDNAMQSLYNDLALEQANLVSLQKELDGISIIEAGFNTAKIWKLNSEIEKSKDNIAKYQYQIEELDKAWENYANNSSIDSLETATNIADDFITVVDKGKQALWNLQTAPNRVSLFMNHTDYTDKMYDAKTIISQFMNNYGKTETTLGINTSMFTSGLSEVKKLWGDTVQWIGDIVPKISIDVDTSKSETSISDFVKGAINSLKSIDVDLDVKASSAVGGAVSALTGGAIGGLKIKAHASGGFPEDGLFMANHGELVGKFSNGRTAVANNEQIVKGIAEGIAPAVYSAVVSAMRDSYSGSDKNVVVNIDGKQVFKAVQKQANNYTMQTGKSAFKF